MEDVASRKLDCIIEDRLFLSSVHEAKDLELLKGNNITHILTIGKDMPALFPQQFTYQIVSEVEDTEVDLLYPYLAGCFSFIDLCFSLKPEIGYFDEDSSSDGEATFGAILVHCEGGVSRSAAVVIAYLMDRLMPTESFETCLSYVQSVRAVVSPNSGFRSQLKLFESMNYCLDTNNSRVSAALKDIVDHGKRSISVTKETGNIFHSDLFEGTETEIIVAATNEEAVDGAMKRLETEIDKLDLKEAEKEQLEAILVPMVVPKLLLKKDHSRTKNIFNSVASQDDSEISRPFQNRRRKNSDTFFLQKGQSLLGDPVPTKSSVSAATPWSGCATEQIRQHKCPRVALSSTTGVSIARLVYSEDHPEASAPAENPDLELQLDQLLKDEQLGVFVKNRNVLSSVANVPTEVLNSDTVFKNMSSAKEMLKEEPKAEPTSNKVRTGAAQVVAKVLLGHSATKTDQQRLKRFLSLSTSDGDIENVPFEGIREALGMITRLNQAADTYERSSGDKYDFQAMRTSLRALADHIEEYTGLKITSRKFRLLKSEDILRAVVNNIDQELSDALQDIQNKKADERGGSSSTKAQIDLLLLFSKLGLRTDLSQNLSDETYRRLTQMLEGGSEEATALESIGQDSLIELLSYLDSFILTSNAVPNPKILRLEKVCGARLALMIQKSTVKEIFDHLADLAPHPHSCKGRIFRSSTRKVARLCLFFSSAVIAEKILNLYVRKGKLGVFSLGHNDIDSGNPSLAMPSLGELSHSASDDFVLGVDSSSPLQRESSTRRKRRSLKRWITAAPPVDGSCKSMGLAGSNEFLGQSLESVDRSSVGRSHALPKLPRGRSNDDINMSTEVLRVWPTSSEEVHGLLGSRGSFRRGSSIHNGSAKGLQTPHYSLHLGRQHHMDHSWSTQSNSLSENSSEADAGRVPLKQAQAVGALSGILRHLSRLTSSRLASADKRDHETFVLQEKLQALHELSSLLPQVQPVVSVADSEERPGLKLLPKASESLKKYILEDPNNWGANQTPYIFDFGLRILVFFKPSDHDTALQRPDDTSAKFRKILRAIFELLPDGFTETSLNNLTETATFSQHASAGFALSTALNFLDKLTPEGTSSLAAQLRLGDDRRDLSGTVAGGYLHCRNLDQGSSFQYVFSEESGHYGQRWMKPGVRQVFSEFMDDCGLGESFLLKPYHRQKEAGSLLGLFGDQLPFDSPVAGDDGRDPDLPDVETELEDFEWDLG